MSSRTKVKRPAATVPAADDVAPSSTARHRVREQVRRLILGGELRPGERLTQQHLAKRFGVAQSVVRESLLELQFTGLVRMIDNLGIFVGELDAETLIQAYEVREMLEGLATRTCCERASKMDMRELKEMAEEIHRLGAAGQDAERGALDRHFHLRIIEISRNQVLVRLIEACRALSMTVQASRPHGVIRREHLAIVAAIEAGDPPEAERAARQHVAGARESLRRQIAAGTFTPQWVVED
jgi:DNA-binding GntR family transcriptional regulator